MKDLLAILRLIWSHEHKALLRGWLLATLVLLSSVALLGLSGWFITAAGVAGVLGVGATFDFFRPSAGVRFLAIGRTLTRYGERLLTHDATLKTLATLRVRLLRSILQQPYEKLLQVRGSRSLNQITADVDALDGLTLRLVTPITAALASLLVSMALLAWLTTPLIGILTVAPLIMGAAIILRISSKHGINPARRAEQATQNLRTGTIDMLRARTDLVMFGAMQQQLQQLFTTESNAREALGLVDRLERRSGLVLSLLATLSTSTALFAGIYLATNGINSPAQAALGFFATLAMAEAIAPIKRSAAEIGRMMDAAGRINSLIQAEPSAPATEILSSPITRSQTGASLQLSHVSYRTTTSGRAVLDDFSLTLHAGETVALAGPSGSGKSTILLLAAGLLKSTEGLISINGQSIGHLTESCLRQQVSLLPQRSALLGGTVLDTLRLADPDVDEEQAWQVLDAIALADVIHKAGGLHSRLLEAGAGLSGGERRRLALARMLLRHAPLLLLDEPTEGLDGITSRRVLEGIDRYAPKATKLIAAHREIELSWANRIEHLEQTLVH
ncbi:thiol reductant ABC exporter subunit CydC [Granulosicoccus antarcticus]|uniref:Putative ABC transporter ATP-binding protein n=1 Tax=Granulosicoccus antarcticus IMCC3135 TaxID=1192854 RepID=A0A2Z2NZL5_9GAMM|nr:thiol reductant ABC exporter subunit CydC [Granulosicoccus antarcticus]ASJ75228.1 putative ABC transporter ATP-binding protein [Granulosicoccus antarcticus IMCC3135]